MSRWARGVIGRGDRELLGMSLDERLDAGHGVRVLDALLDEAAWAEWEGRYACEGAGRPAVHPREMSAAILYGTIKGIHSSRQLEEAACMRLDFQWLLHGVRIDHSTICTFRNQFERELTGLFKTLNRRAVAIRKSTLTELLIDGTRILANSGRHGARTAAALEKQIAEAEELFRRTLHQSVLAERDETQATPAEIEELLQHQRGKLEKLQRALAVARERDADRRRDDGRNATPVRVPVSDPDAFLLPNKEGGFAPNYTPVAAVESEHGLIVGCGVATGHAEADEVPALLGQVAEIAPGAVKRVLADGAFPTGENLTQLDKQGVEMLAPIGAAGRPGNPAIRENPAVPVPAELHGKLPLRGGKLDAAAFVYDAVKDVYFCPMGRLLNCVRNSLATVRGGRRVQKKEYRCVSCEGCPLAGICLKNPSGARSVGRDIYEPLRERLAARMRTAEARLAYRRRAPFAEGTFGIIKSVLGFRRFLRRGMVKVSVDWLCVCTAFNLKKLMAAPAPA